VFNSLFGQISVKQISVKQILVKQILVKQILVEQISVEQISVEQISVEQISVDQTPRDRRKELLSNTHSREGLKDKREKSDSDVFRDDQGCQIFLGT
jgi:hypothetical protein